MRKITDLVAVVNKQLNQLAAGKTPKEWIPYDSKVGRIRRAAFKNLKAGQVLYKKEYGVKHTAKAIDRALTVALAEACILGKTFVEIPIEVALALWLRAAGRGRGPTRRKPPDLTPWMEAALRLQAEILKQNPSLTRPEAAKKAAEVFWSESGHDSIDSFVADMTRPGRWKRKRKRKGPALSAGPN